MTRHQLPATSDRDAPVYATEICSSKQRASSSEEETDLYECTASTQSSTLGYSTNNTSTTNRSSFGTDGYYCIAVEDDLKEGGVISKLKGDVSDSHGSTFSVKYLSRLFESNLHHVADQAAELDRDHYGTVASLSDETTYDVLSHDQI